MFRVRRLFVAAAALLYVGFLVLDLTRAADSAPLKFAAISLCFAAALPGVRTADGRLTALALAFAVCADRFLLAPDGRYLLGVSLFCVVQALYCARLIRWRGGIRRSMLALRLLPLAAFLFAQNALPALVLLYFVNLVCSALEAVCFRPASRQTRLFALGLALLICCDICVGAFNLGLWTGFTRVGMWLFYLPSQVLVVLSADPKGV